ncbi:MAG TPA: S-methyl-5-thioribose-1-phosphate isomerase [bacterium]|nr:S-methyl-5-thioribose-1-phosphate isomerase [bacterium]
MELRLDTIRWLDEGNIELLDQTLLPSKIKYEKLRTVESVASAIEKMKVRGAPAIGVTAAMGIALDAVKFKGRDKEKFFDSLKKAMDRLSVTRPTAVNLFWAIDRMQFVAEKNKNKTIDGIKDILVREAKKIHAEDISSCKKMGDNGAALLQKGSRVLTHCNAGGLATAGYGTALGVIRSGYRKKKIERVYVDETRPWLQGAKLTAFEMVQEGIPATLICDNMAASLMAKGMIDAVIVGADRIAANGDVANKIGTYSVAVIARAHKIPFYVAAPVSTIDFTLNSGKKIVIEERGELEVRRIGSTTICPGDIDVINPAFDVTPFRLITSIITEKGVCSAPYTKSLKDLIN